MLNHHHCTKNHIFFFQVFCKDNLFKKKKLHWNMIFLVSSGKMIFLFPENMILFFRRKMKDDLSQKKYMEIWYILQMFRKDGLSKKIALEYDLSYIMRKDGISFSRKYDIFFTDGKWKIIFLKKCMEIWCFLYVGKGGISKVTFPALLKKMIFILEKMILAFSVLLWRPF